MHLLINEPFLQFDPQTARKIGLNESVLLQQIHQLSFGIDDTLKGTQVVARSYSEWHAVMPFWSMATIIRTIKRLEKTGLISSVRHNQGHKNYLVDYQVCEAKSIELSPPVDEEVLNIN